jgi:hypothetical protein
MKIQSGVNLFLKALRYQYPDIVDVYLQQILTVGYSHAPLEIDARQHAII